MMKEYNFENKLVFVIDEDGDSFESFQQALVLIQNYIKPNVFEFINPYWNGSNGYFIKDGITVYLDYSNWNGTTLRVDESVIDLSTVRQWAEEIYNAIHNNESPLL